MKRITLWGLILLIGALSCGDGVECDKLGAQRCIDEHRLEACAPVGNPEKSDAREIIISDCREINPNTPFCFQSQEDSASCRSEPSP